MNNAKAHTTAKCWCGHGGPSHYGEENGYLACKECSARPQVDDTPMPMLVAERRRFDRFSMPHPIRTTVGSSPAYVVDASISGIGLMQHATAPPVGSTCKVMFHSEFGPITLQCEVARAVETEGTFQTGLRIVAADDESDSRLRMLVMNLAVPTAKRPHSH